MEGLPIFALATYLSMIFFSDLALPAKAGFAKAGNRLPPPIMSEGKLFAIILNSRPGNSFLSSKS
jgi:hypothetical protein